MSAVTRGSFTAVGVGIRPPSQTTLEASAHIERADKVFSLVANPLAEYWVHSLNKNTESLGYLYGVGKDRWQTYREMVERLVGAVHAHQRVCAVSYGHPGVFAYPFHEAIRRLRKDGYMAEMLAGVSAEDCLFAELGVDPAVAGCHSYEATDFLVHRRAFDAASALILWQIGAIAEFGYKEEDSAWNLDGLVVLTETLLATYRPDHEVIVYEAAFLPACNSKVVRVELGQLPQAPISAISTLYVPPMTKPEPDQAMLRRLGMSESFRRTTAALRSG